VLIPLKEPHSFNVLLGIRKDFDGVYLSLEDPDGFVAALRAPR
jgi:hypothetical protein